MREGEGGVEGMGKGKLRVMVRVRVRVRGVLYGKKVKPFFLKKAFFLSTVVFLAPYTAFFFDKNTFFLCSKQVIFFLAFDIKIIFHVKWSKKKRFFWWEN